MEASIYHEENAVPAVKHYGQANLDLSVLIKHFEVPNKTEGKSPRTVGWYNEVLSLLYRWLQGGTEVVPKIWTGS